MKLYIVANRLPVKAVPRQDSYTFVRSEGGLATGLDSLQISMEKHWIGWPGVCVDNARQQIEIRQHLETMDFHPIFLSEEQYTITTKDTVIVPFGLCAIISFPILRYGKSIGSLTRK